MLTLDLKKVVMKQAQEAKQTIRQLAGSSTNEKNEALSQMSQSLWEERMAIMEANQADVDHAREAGTAESRIDRLIITEQRLREMIDGLEQIRDLADPIGETISEQQRPNGLLIRKKRVPFGVIAMIYESRPNVTVDTVGLALKTGNAVVLRGGKEALRTNRALVLALKKGLQQTTIPTESIQLIDQTSRETVDILIKAKGLIDLVIPRGGAGLIQRVVEHAQVPVIETGVGNCHVYLHQSAEPTMAKEIAINAKTQRPSVCNAIETLLVDHSWAKDHLLVVVESMQDKGVELLGCSKTRAITGTEKVTLATEQDYATEHLDTVLSIKVVEDIEEALDHIDMYGTRHSEAIVAEDPEAVERFFNQVDAAAVYHNASTRFTDGFVFGFGAEIGISTQKLHARGPMGLSELTSYKYVVEGTGQIRT